VVAQFDFDGDGRDALVVVDESWEQKMPAVSEMHVLRAVRGAIEPYPVGFHVDQISDADGDGRPDFVADAYFGVAEPRRNREGTASIARRSSFTRCLTERSR